jgi:alpha-L-fucosidase 2
MTRNFFLYLLPFAFFFQGCTNQKSASERELKLWYKKAAQEWVEALPIGNGRLGAMVFGGTETERIQLNEESVWTGGPIERANPEALENLNKVRQLLFEGKYAEGDRLAQEKIMGKRIDGGKHTYQTLGDLLLEFKGLGEISNYKRELDLRTATTTTTFESDGVHYSREIFASAPDQVIVAKFTASKKGKLSFTTWLERPGKAEVVSATGNQIVMTGFAQYEGRGTRFASVVNVDNKGGEIVNN